MVQTAQHGLGDDMALLRWCHLAPDRPDDSLCRWVQIIRAVKESNFELNSEGGDGNRVILSINSKQSHNRLEIEVERDTGEGAWRPLSDGEMLASGLARFYEPEII